MEVTEISSSSSLHHCDKETERLLSLLNSVSKAPRKSDVRDASDVLEQLLDNGNNSKNSSWQEYYDEEKDKLLMLLNSVSKIPIRSRKKNSVDTERNDDEYTRKLERKHYLIQKLMKIRGKVYLEHEKILEAEKRAMITEYETSLHQEITELEKSVAIEQRELLKERLLLRLRSLIVPWTLTDPVPQDILEDELINRYAIPAAKIVNRNGDEYARKVYEKGMAAIRKGLKEESQRFSGAISSIHDENNPNQNTIIPPINALDSDLQRILLEKRQKFHEKYYNATYFNALSAADKTKVRLIEKKLEEVLILGMNVITQKHLKHI